MRPHFFKTALGLIAVMLVVTALRQHHQNTALRAEAEQARVKNAELAKLREEHARLVTEQPSTEEWGQLREAQTETARLRAETAALRVRSEPPAPATVEAAKPNAEPWTNAGRG